MHKRAQKQYLSDELRNEEIAMDAATKEGFLTALTDARKAMCTALNLAPGVFTKECNWETFNNRAHWMLVSIDKAKEAVSKKEVNE
jgi:hypothetical protein